jgi:putative hydrolase of the HAD superfamily
MIHSRTGRCVVFDLDDTLYDEIDFVRSGFDAVAGAVGNRYAVDCKGFLHHRLDIGHLDGAFQGAIRLCNLPDSALAFMVETYRAHKPNIRLRGGVAAALDEVRRSDGVIGCITDGRGTTQRNKIDALGLSGIFDVLLISEETGHGKPDPYNFREVMRLVAADVFWYVADNPAKDFVGPNALGWTTIGIEGQKLIHPPDGLTLPPGYAPQLQLPLAEVLTCLHQPARDRSFP